MIRMTDSEILAAAARIRRREAAEREAKSFETGRDLAIRWTTTDSKPGEAGYVSVMVDPDLVREIVRAHFAAVISANQTYPERKA